MFDGVIKTVSGFLVGATEFFCGENHRLTSSGSFLFLAEDVVVNGETFTGCTIDESFLEEFFDGEVGRSLSDLLF